MTGAGHDLGQRRADARRDDEDDHRRAHARQQRRGDLDRRPDQHEHAVRPSGTRPAGRSTSSSTARWRGAAGGDRADVRERRDPARRARGAGTASIQVALPERRQRSTSTRAGSTSSSTARRLRAAAPSTSPSGAALELRNGTFNLGATSAINGAGLVEVSGATVNVNGAYGHNGTLLVSGGALNLTPAPTLATLRVTGGTLNLATAASDATVAALQLVGGTLTGPGDVTVSGRDDLVGRDDERRPARRSRTAADPRRHDQDARAHAREQRRRHVDGRSVQPEHAGDVPQPGRPDVRHPVRRHDGLGHGREWSRPSPTTARSRRAAGPARRASRSRSRTAARSRSERAGSDVFQHSATTTSTGTFSVPPGSALELRNGTFNLDPASTVAGGGLVDVTGGTVNVAGSYTPDDDRASRAARSTCNNACQPHERLALRRHARRPGRPTVANFTWTGRHARPRRPSATSTTVTGSLELSGATKTLTRRTFENDVPARTPTTWAVGNLDAEHRGDLQPPRAHQRHRRPGHHGRRGDGLQRPPGRRARQGRRRREHALHRRR